MLSSAGSGRPFIFEGLGGSKARLAHLYGEPITGDATDCTTLLVRSDGSLEYPLTGIHLILWIPVGNK